MKKELLLTLVVCSLTLLQHTASASSNGTIVNGQYMIQDFEGFTLSQSLEMGNIFGGPIVGTATVVANPTQGSQKVAHIVMTNSNYNTLLKLNVTLPAGKSMRDFTHISFDLYRSASGDANNKQMHISVDGTQIYQDANYIQQANTTTWTTKTYAIPGNAPTANSFVMLLGIKTDNGNHMLDNIRLSYTLTTAPTANSADQVSPNGFTANWGALFGVEDYRLDVATDAGFTNMVAGYNNLNVGNVTSYAVSGLDDNTTYYYRVRGAKSDGTSPSSGTISTTTLSGDTYVLPNLDPVPETDPTPATINGASIFLIADYEANAINDVLSLSGTHVNSSATVKADLIIPSNKAAHVIIKNYSLYYRLSVTLPQDKVLADYQKLSFNYYLNGTKDNQNKSMEARINSSTWKSNSATNNLNQWLLMEFNIDNHSAGNTFTLDLGFNTNDGDFFIDNVKLIPSAPTATTATAATHIYATGFKAQWSLFQGSTAYFLDVATNNTFTNFVSGYENLNVGDVANYVVTGLTPGTTYYYRIRGTNTSTQSNTITVVTKAATAAASHFTTRSSGNISDMAIWQSSTNNTGWMNATAAPTGDAKSIRVLKGHQLTVDDDFSGAEIIVRAGGQLSVAAGKELELSGRLFLESNEADGTATFINEGTLTVPANNAIVKQYLTSKTRPVPVGETPASNDDWWYISSPVTGATSAVFDPASTAETRNRIGYFNEVTQLYPQILTNDVALTSGKGYLAKLGANATVSFEGALNNGDVNVDITRTGTSHAKRGFNLVGNPYPSYLNWNMVRGSRTDISTSIWYRTRNDGGEMVFDTYNGLSGTNLGKKGAVNQHIPPMQAFWVRVLNDGVSGDPLQNTVTLNFTNQMRSHQNQALNNNQLRAPGSNGVGTLRLELSNDTHRDEALILVYEDALNGIDKYDAPKFSNNNTNIPEIYTITDNEELVINTLKTIPSNSTMSLGFRPGKSGQFTISATEVQLPDSEVDVILKDNVTGVETELNEGASYTFNSDNLVTSDRFNILFKSTGSISNLEDNQAGRITVSTTANRQLIVTTTKALSPSATVTVYNTLGQKIATRPLTGNITLIGTSLDKGVYLLIVDDSGKQTSLKAILN